MNTTDSNFKARTETVTVVRNIEVSSERLKRMTLNSYFAGHFHKGGQIFKLHDYIPKFIDKHTFKKQS